MNAQSFEIEPRVMVEIADDLLLPGQEVADMALDRAKAALEDLALAFHGRDLARRHFSAVTREIGESFLRLARAS